MNTIADTTATPTANPAASSSIALQLILPDRVVEDRQTTMVVIPGEDGDVGIMLGHAPLVITIRPGFVCIFNNDRVERYYYLSGGVAKINPQQVVILAEEAEPLDEIDAVSLQVAINQALDPDEKRRLQHKYDIITRLPYTTR